MNTIKTLGLLAILLFTSTAFPQAVREVVGGVMVSVPVRVIYEQPENCHFTVEAAEIGPIPRAQIDAALPKDCPVFTRLPSGELLEGFSVTNWKGVETESLSYCFPGYVIFDQKILYKVTSTPNTMYAASCSTPSSLSAPLFTADYRFQMQIFDRLPIKYQSTYSRRAGFSMALQIPEGYTVPPGVSVTEVNTILQRVKDRFSRLLEASNGDVLIGVLFGNTNGPAVVTQSAQSNGTVSQIRNAFQFASFFQDENEAIQFSDAFPPGNISCTWNANISNQVQTITVPNTLIDQITVPLNPSPYDAVITVNPQVSFDFDPTDGVDANKIDFEYVIMHEVMHALGFDSSADLQQSTRNQITMMDIWRFPALNSVSDAAFAGTQPGTSRWMVNNNTQIVPVLGCKLNDPSLTFNLSQGQGAIGFQAQHWQPLAQAGYYIGVVKADTGFGETSPVPGYLTIADQAALDAIGWNIDLPIPVVAPGGPVIDAPLTSQQVSISPRCSWQTGLRTDTFKVTVYQTGVISAANRVYQQMVPGSQTTVVLPPAIFQPGQSYGVVIAAINSFDFAASPLRTFTVVAGLCDSGDFNGDGDSGTDADIEAFFTCLAGDCCLTCSDGDFNNDGDTGTDQDIKVFFESWPAESADLARSEFVAAIKVMWSEVLSVRHAP